MDIKNVAIVGAGLMGSGIAQVVAGSGFKVTLCSRRGLKGTDRLYEGVRKAVVRKILNEEQANQLLSRVSSTSSFREAMRDADLIIEAVVEDLAIKRTIFERIDAHCMQQAIIASNTSSLSISSLAEATKRAGNVVGMHFFNPAPVMKLVEVIRGAQTSEETVNRAIAFLQRIGKVPIVVKDTPGFVVNRILMPAINAAAFVLMNKVATAEMIDSAIRLGANHPMGPLELADLIGIDVCLNIIKEIYARLENPGFEICPLLEEMVVKGNLGRKTGQGFYTYNSHH